MNSVTCGNLPRYNASDFDDGGPFAEDLPKAPVVPPKKDTKRKRKTQEKTTSKKSETKTKTTTATSRGGKKKKPNNQTPSPVNSTGNVQEPVGQHLIMPEECMKYETLRRKYLALVHDMAHLRYRYQTELLGKSISSSSSSSSSSTGDKEEVEEEETTTLTQLVQSLVS